MLLLMLQLSGFFRVNLATVTITKHLKAVGLPFCNSAMRTMITATERYAKFGDNI